MFVMTPWVGASVRQSSAISPGWFVPISITATSCVRLSRKSVIGTPMWLLRFPSVERTLYFSPRTFAIISFVVVLPLLPPTARKGMRNLSR